MARAELTLEASYYNLSHNAWEPILEPVVDPDDESHYTPWTLQADVLYYTSMHATVVAKLYHNNFMMDWTLYMMCYAGS